MSDSAGTGESPLPPLVSAQVNYLVTHFPQPIKVERIWSGSKSGRYADRFSLLIPFCLDHIKWDFVYNEHYPASAPDVIFGPEDEGFQPLLALHGAEGSAVELPPVDSCLWNWDYLDSHRLLALVQELRDAYIAYHRKRVEEVDDDRLKFELSSILHQKGIEVCLSPSNGRPTEAKFSIPLLDADYFIKLVPNCSWKYPQNIYLQVSFPIASAYSPVPSAPRTKLISTPELKAFMSIDEVTLPAWVDGMCMADYVSTLVDRLAGQAVEASASIGGRKRFIETLAVTFGRPLEADPVFCTRASVLSTAGNFAFLIHFFIPLQFPRQQPILTLQSTQHFKLNGVPISYSLNGYPWSPRWEPTQMVERIFDFLVDECQSFKRYCTETIPPQH